MMDIRLKYWTVAPEAVKRMMHLNAYLEESSIEAGLRDLVFLRVSQINGCAYCVDLHAHEALRVVSFPISQGGPVTLR